MTIKVMIKRKVFEDKINALTPLLRQLRARAMEQPGYISGETLARLDKQGECLVIGTWQSENDWREWLLNTERIDLQDKIDSVLGEKTAYEIYKYD